MEYESGEEERTCREGNTQAQFVSTFKNHDQQAFTTHGIDIGEGLGTGLGKTPEKKDDIFG